MEADELRQQLEMSVVELLKARLEDGSLTEERSQQVSQCVLDLLQPGMNMEEILRTVPKLDDACPELAPIVLPFLRQYKETIARQGEKNVTELIRQGQFDAAAKLAEQVMSQDVGPTWVGSGKPE